MTTPLASWHEHLRRWGEHLRHAGLTLLKGLEAEHPLACQPSISYEAGYFTSAIALPIAAAILRDKPVSDTLLPSLEPLVRSFQTTAQPADALIADVGGSRRPAMTGLTLHLLAEHLPKDHCDQSGLRNILSELGGSWIGSWDGPGMMQDRWARVWELDLDCRFMFETLDHTTERLVFDKPQPMREMLPDESLDGYIFDELCSLQALAHLVVRSKRFPEDLGRLPSACLYHLENTQPDNVTNQPWGLAAFMLLPETESFAQQQVHDCLTFANQQQFSPAATITSLLLLADSLHIATHAVMS